MSGVSAPFSGVVAGALGLCAASASAAVSRDLVIDLSGQRTDADAIEMPVEPGGWMVGFGWDLRFEMDAGYEPFTMGLGVRGEELGFLLNLWLGDRIGAFSSGGVHDFADGDQNRHWSEPIWLGDDGVLTIRSMTFDVDGTDHRHPGPGGVYLDGSTITVRYIPGPGAATLMAGFGLLSAVGRRRS